MMRVRVTGTGWAGSPSLNTFYFRDLTDFDEAAQAAVDRVRSFFSTPTLIWPSTVTHSVDGAVDVVDPATGAVTDTLSVAGGAPIPHSSSSGLMTAPATAGVLTWTTGTFIGGRRVRGRAFISPLRQDATEANGSPDANFIAALNAAGDLVRIAAGLLPELVVWHRPKGVIPGSAAPVIAHSVADKFGVLRSRRD